MNKIEHLFICLRVIHIFPVNCSCTLLISSLASSTPLILIPLIIYRNKISIGGLAICFSLLVFREWGSPSQYFSPQRIIWATLYSWNMLDYFPLKQYDSTAQFTQPIFYQQKPQNSPILILLTVLLKIPICLQVNSSGHM